MVNIVISFLDTPVAIACVSVCLSINFSHFGIFSKFLPNLGQSILTDGEFKPVKGNN